MCILVTSVGPARHILVTLGDGTFCLDQMCLKKLAHYSYFDRRSSLADGHSSVVEFSGSWRSSAVEFLNGRHSLSLWVVGAVWQFCISVVLQFSKSTVLSAVHHFGTSTVW